MRSYVVKRLPHFRHSRRRRMESASLLSRESTTLSFSKPQKGHFMSDGEVVACIVTGGVRRDRRRQRPRRPGAQARLPKELRGEALAFGQARQFQRTSLSGGARGHRPYVTRGSGRNHPAGGVTGTAVTASSW